LELHALTLVARSYALLTVQWCSLYSLRLYFSQQNLKENNPFSYLQCNTNSSQNYPKLLTAGRGDVLVGAVCLLSPTNVGRLSAEMWVIDYSCFVYRLLDKLLGNRQIKAFHTLVGPRTCT